LTAALPAVGYALTVVCLLLALAVLSATVRGFQIGSWLLAVLAVLSAVDAFVWLVGDVRGWVRPVNVALGIALSVGALVLMVRIERGRQL